MDLKGYLEKYKDLTILLINRIQNDDELSDLFKQREEIIKKIGELDFSKEEIRNIYNDLKIEILEKKLENSLKSEKVEIRRKIEKIKQARVARNNYVKMDPRPFSLFTQR